MKPTKLSWMKRGLMCVAVAAMCLTATARRQHGPVPPRPYGAPVVVVRPDRPFHVKHRPSNRAERLGVALDYLRGHRYLTVNRYVRLTGLSKRVATAELESFVRDRRTPLAAVRKGRSTVYVCR